MIAVNTNLMNTEKSENRLSFMKKQAIAKTEEIPSKLKNVERGTRSFNLQCKRFRVLFISTVVERKMVITMLVAPPTYPKFEIRK